MFYYKILWEFLEIATCGKHLKNNWVQSVFNSAVLIFYLGDNCSIENQVWLHHLVISLS